MVRMRDTLGEMSSHSHGVAGQTANTSALVENLLDKEGQYLQDRIDSEDKNDSRLQQQRDKLAAANDRLNDAQQHTQDLIDSQRQKQEDEEVMIQQRMADQEEHIQTP